MISPSEIQIQSINHLGIIAGIIDDLGIEEIINEEIGVELGEKVTSGQIVKAIILNGLGFISKPLYLFPQFFADKATEHLIGKGIFPEHINEYKIGRVMDLIYAKGLTNIFLLIALKAANKYQVKTSYSHLDSTSFSVEGEYKKVQKKAETEQDSDGLEPITITYGYSRDRRPDLKQYILDLIVSGDGGIPLFLKVADGNESDKAVFGKIAQKYKSMITFETTIVCDAALYTDKNIKLMKGIKWISRVPFSIKEAKILVNQISSKDFSKSDITGYLWYGVKSNYGGVEQRWLLVESEKRKKADLKQLEEKIEKEKEKINQDLRKINTEKYESEQILREKINLQEKSLKYHELREIEVKIKENQGTPQKRTSPKQKNVDTHSKSTQTEGKINYQIKFNIQLNESKIENLKRTCGRFILATNELDEKKLSNDNLLKEYKEQQTVERGFGFLKDPLFFADSVFLKSPERIETMTMLMGLCLLVYSIGQRELRLRLNEAQTGLKNQLGKITNRPTLRWIFQCLQGIHWVIISGVQQIVNLTEERRLTLSFFPPSCQKYYILSG